MVKWVPLILGVVMVIFGSLMAVGSFFGEQMMLQQLVMRVLSFFARQLQYQPSNLSFVRYMFGFVAAVGFVLMVYGAVSRPQSRSDRETNAIQ